MEPVFVMMGGKAHLVNFVVVKSGIRNIFTLLIIGVKSIY